MRRLSQPILRLENEKEGSGATPIFQYHGFKRRLTRGRFDFLTLPLLPNYFRFWPRGLTLTK